MKEREGKKEGKERVREIERGRVRKRGKIEQFWTVTRLQLELEHESTSS